MSDQLISLEELKQIISEVKAINIKTKVGKHPLDDEEYTIVKDNIKIKFVVPLIKSSNTSNVIFKFNTDSEGVWESYPIDYYELVAPLAKSYASRSDRREAILKAFNIAEETSDNTEDSL